MAAVYRIVIVKQDEVDIVQRPGLLGTPPSMMTLKGRSEDFILGQPGRSGFRHVADILHFRLSNKVVLYLAT